MEEPLDSQFEGHANIETFSESTKKEKHNIQGGKQKPQK
jgi:hypothetical protein